jgi:putative transposase
MAFTRRHLPHWIPENTAIFVTGRLAGSLPPQAKIPFLQQDEQLDSMRSGSDWLHDSRVACVVAHALLYGEKIRGLYELHAWVVMPNHVHVIFQPRAGMASIMRWLKGRTSRVANQVLARTGKPFWQDESFDHWVRSPQELQDLIHYVENNPVKAGLVEAKEQWPWSSATRAV